MFKFEAQAKWRGAAYKDIRERRHFAQQQSLGICLQSEGSYLAPFLVIHRQVVISSAVEKYRVLKARSLHCVLRTLVEMIKFTNCLFINESIVRPCRRTLFGLALKPPYSNIFTEVELWHIGFYIEHWCAVHHIDTFNI